MSLTGPNSIPKSLSVVWGNILDASDEDAEEAIAFLKGLVRDIRFENTDEIVLRERGFPPLARRDQALKGHTGNCSHCSPRGHALQHSGQSSHRCPLRSCSYPPTESMGFVWSNHPSTVRALSHFWRKLAFMASVFTRRDPRRLHECLDELEIVEWFRRIHLFDPLGSKHTM